MNYASTLKSMACTFIVGTGIATLLPASHLHAMATQPLTGTSFCSRHIGSLTRPLCKLITSDTAKRNLCLAAIALPIFGLYARKPLQRLWNSYTRTRKADNENEEPIDYFDTFTDAFSKTTTLVGKIFKVISIFTAATGTNTATTAGWIDMAAKL